MTSSLQKVKEIDQMSADLVLGYIKNEESLLQLQNVPLLVSYRILLFYYLKEYFAKCGKGMEISQDKLMIIKRNGAGWINTTYLNRWIDSESGKVLRWKFKIEKCQQFGGGLCFGVTSNKNLMESQFASSNKYHCNSSFCGSSASGKSSKFGEGDYVTYTLDLINKTFSVKINNEKECILYKNIRCGVQILFGT